MCIKPHKKKSYTEWSSDLGGQRYLTESSGLYGLFIVEECDSSKILERQSSSGVMDPFYQKMKSSESVSNCGESLFSSMSRSIFPVTASLYEKKRRHTAFFEKQDKNINFGQSHLMLYIFMWLLHAPNSNIVAVDLATQVKSYLVTKNQAY